MYNKTVIDELIKFVELNDGIADKSKLLDKVQEKFKLVKDRSVYYCSSFAIRFSQSTSKNMSNTVLSLSSLQKYDKEPVFVCIVTPQKNYLKLMNVTFIKKVSHSSQQLRIDNIKGSINGSDIVNDFNGVLSFPFAGLDLEALSNKPSTDSCNILLSLFKITSGVGSDIIFFKRSFLMIILR